MAIYFILWVIIQSYYYFIVLFKLLRPLETPTSWFLVLLPCPILFQTLPYFLAPQDVPVSFDSVNLFE